MAKYTPNYKFKKPEQGEKYNVDDFNRNTDMIEAAFMGKADNGHRHNAGELTGVLTADKGGTGIDLYGVGDMLFALTSTELGMLGIGGEGDVMQVEDGTPTWVKPDSVPTKGSSAMVTSGGLYEAIAASGMDTGVHRLKVTLDNNYTILASNTVNSRYQFNTVEEVSLPSEYKHGDLVFVTFEKLKSFKENEQVNNKEITIDDDTIGSKLGYLNFTLQFITMEGASANRLLTIDDIPLAPRTILFTVIGSEISNLKYLNAIM